MCSSARVFLAGVLTRFERCVGLIARKGSPATRTGLRFRRPGRVSRRTAGWLAVAALLPASPLLAQQIVAVSRADPSMFASSAGGSSPAVSSDGRYIAFVGTAENLVTGQVDTNTATDVFLFDRVAGTVTLVSHVAGSLTTAANAGSDTPVISGDGAYVVFRSAATDLVAGQVDTTNPGEVNFYDIFLFERATGAIMLLSRPVGLPAVALGGDYPAISADGRYIAFSSPGTNLVVGQTGSADSVFLLERTTGTLTLVSHAAATSTTTANNASSNPVLSADGGYVAFVSYATDLVTGEIDANNNPDVLLYERAPGRSRW